MSAWRGGSKNKKEKITCWAVPCAELKWIRKLDTSSKHPVLGHNHLAHWLEDFCNLVEDDCQKLLHRRLGVLQHWYNHSLAGGEKSIQFIHEARTLMLRMPRISTHLASDGYPGFSCTWFSIHYLPYMDCGNTSESFELSFYHELQVQRRIQLPRQTVEQQGNWRNPKKWVQNWILII